MAFGPKVAQLKIALALRFLNFWETHPCYLGFTMMTGHFTAGTDFFMNNKHVNKFVLPLIFEPFVS